MGEVLAHIDIAHLKSPTEYRLNKKNSKSRYEEAPNLLIKPPRTLQTMPKSKRAKVVHLSKTTKKGKELTIRLYTNIRECIPNYPYIYVFRVDNMRNTYLKDVRTQLSDSRYAYIPIPQLGYTQTSLDLT